jgi:hypothetical protein
MLFQLNGESVLPSQDIVAFTDVLSAAGMACGWGGVLERYQGESCRKRWALLRVLGSSKLSVKKTFNLNGTTTRSGHLGVVD